MYPIIIFGIGEYIFSDVIEFVEFVSIHSGIFRSEKHSVTAISKNPNLAIGKVTDSGMKKSMNFSIFFGGQNMPAQNDAVDNQRHRNQAQDRDDIWYRHASVGAAGLQDQALCSLLSKRDAPVVRSKVVFNHKTVIRQSPE